MLAARGRTRLVSRRRCYLSTSAVHIVRIGNVERPVRTDLTDEQKAKIPKGFLHQVLQQDDQRHGSAHHLQWLMQKDVLRQDALLVASTSSVYTRRLALAYAELTHRPVEVLVLSRDTTDADLKQRRVLVSSNNNPPDEAANRHGDDGPRAVPQHDPAAAVTTTTTIRFVDQAPVRAARFGHTLILDGLQYAERNVLASLNNLLENREMPLEDGTILTNRTAKVAAADDGSNASAMGNDAANAARWVPVHADFRVIALYNVESSSSSYTSEHSSLDPPVRSRFSIRRIDAPELDDTLAMVPHVVPTVSTHALSTVPRVAALFPDQPLASLLMRRYTFDKDPATRRTFERLCKEMKIASPKAAATAGYADEPIHMKRLDDGKLLYNNRIVASGPEVSQSFSHYIATTTSDAALTAMLQEHAADRHLLVTTRQSGTGKSVLAEQFARLLGYGTPLLFPLYPELTSRDLLLRRGGHDEPSPLVTAALEGRLCILDNVHAVTADLLATLQSLLVDGQVWLPDGRHIVAHEAFRVVGLGVSSLSGSNPNGGESNRGLLTATTTLDMFSWIEIQQLTEDCYRRLLRPHNRSFSEPQLEQLLRFRQMVADNDADNYVGSSLTLRDLKRIVRQGHVMELHDSIRATMVVDLMPKSRREIIDDYLHRSGVAPKQQQKRRKGGGGDAVTSWFSESKEEVEEQMVITTDAVHYGRETFPRRTAPNADLVPKPFFFNIPSQQAIIRILLREWANGERSFLLLGNQGTGKNKICDRVCELMNHEREYIQLHRDSTIGQLTIAPSIENGRIVWVDSALIRAVRHGRALVVDEADKAPLEVVVVLKSLVEDGQMLLADGRRILREPSGKECDQVIPIHKDFTLWVLANRPGRKFHGNNLHASIGDCFRSHVIPNPDLDSEIALLRSYAPKTARHDLAALAESFAELRRLFESGDISYPYSTREAVAVVKHLEQFPDRGVADALHNVIDLDSFDDDLYRMIRTIFKKNGIGLPKDRFTSTVDDKPMEIQYIDKNGGKSSVPPPLSMPKEGKVDEQNQPHVGGNTWHGGTGGSDTAGLGGRGGPYRVDSGHPVHQVSDAAKAEVSQQAKEAARRINRKAFEDRLREIEMSEEEHNSYVGFVQPIQSEIAALKSTLDMTKHRGNERAWLKGQLDGELDTSRLVEGVAGEKHVFKRRAKLPEHRGSKKTYIRFVFDCSASMYRFGGYDQRLVRSLQAAALVMEAFDGASDQFVYSMVGHSGDSKRIELSDFGRPPANPKERMVLLQTMAAHAQFSDSGDNTLAAIRCAVDDVSKCDGNTIVIVISDANFDRYGITAQDLKNAMKGSAKTFCIFIAGFGDEATKIQESTPLGKVSVCKDTSELPKTFRDILTGEIDHSW